MTFKVHVDGYNLLPSLKDGAQWPRHEFLYWTDDGNIAALRYDQWKLTFLRQDAHSLEVWQEPFVELRAPLIANLRSDPFERGEYEGIDYGRWFIDHAFVLAPAAAYIGQWLQSFREFPPSQKPGSFNLSRILDMVTSGSPVGNN